MNSSRDHPHLRAIENALATGLDARKIAFKYFNENKSTCYSYLFNLLNCLMERSRNRPSPLACTLMQFFSDWIVNADVTEQLDFKFKTRVVKCVHKHKDPALLNLVFSVFEIERDIDDFERMVRSLLSQRNITQAYYIVECLKLHKGFSIYEILLPLLFEDKRDLVNRYLRSYPECLPEFVKTLDDVCLDRQNIRMLICSLNIDTRRAKFDCKWLRRAITTIIKDFNMVPDKNLNCHLAQSRGAVRHLLYKRYVEESISENSLMEFAIELVKDIPSLQEELLIDMVASNDSETALKVAKELNVPRDKWPESLCYFDSTEKISKLSHSDSERWDSGEEDDETKNLTLELDFSKINVVVNVDQLFDFIQDVSEHYDVVGFDSEWKPSFVGKSKQSLLQFGVTDKVYLIDLVSLKPSLQQKHLEYLFKSIFCSPVLLKLGYGIQHDLKLLAKDCLDTTKDHNFAAVLDLGSFYEKLLSDYPQLPSVLEQHHVGNGNSTCGDDLKGLSKLSFAVLGKPLCKQQQLTNWEKRPLSVPQITYAALDAFCLVQIYQHLSSALKEIGVDIKDVAKKHLSGASQNKKRRKSVELRNMLHYSTIVEDHMFTKPGVSCSRSKTGERPPILVKNFKVVVDNMLVGLGRRLRLLGIDTVILPDGKNHLLAAKIAAKENRIILSNGAPLEMVKCHIPEEMCCNVSFGLSAKAQAEFVLQHYNVQVSEEDIFSRCAMCNSDDFLEIPSKDLESLWKMSSAHSSRTMIGSPPFQISSYGNGYVEVVQNCAIMHTGVKIRLHDRMDPVPGDVFHHVHEFLVCTGCGKVYWQGSHFSRAKTSLNNTTNSPPVPVEKLSAKEQEQYREQVCSQVLNLLNSVSPHNLLCNVHDKNGTRNCVKFHCSNFLCGWQHPLRANGHLAFLLRASSVMGRNSLNWEDEGFALSHLSTTKLRDMTDLNHYPYVITSEEYSNSDVD